MTDLRKQDVVPPSTSYRTIPLTQGKVAIVDAGDYTWLMQWKWHAVKIRDTWYASRNTPGSNRPQKSLRMHTALTGVIPTDHINRDGLDNRRENLRPCTPSENSANRRVFKNNLSGYKGVSRNSRGWMARIRKNGKLIHLGTTSTPEAAAYLYDKAAKDIHGCFAYLNFQQAK